MATEEEIIETSRSADASKTDTSVQINDKPTIDPAHEKILNQQVHTEEFKSSYWQLYGHATKFDWFLMIFGLICAAISGAAVVSIFLF